MIKLKNLLEQKNMDKLRIMTTSQLGIKTVYRTNANEFYKGKAVWGTGRYYSLSSSDVLNISTDGTYKEYNVKPMKVAVADMSYYRPLPIKKPPRPKDRDINDDYIILHKMMKKGDLSKVLKGVDGLVIYTDSMAYGYSQLVVFPKAQNKVKEK